MRKQLHHNLLNVLGKILTTIVLVFITNNLFAQAYIPSQISTYDTTLYGPIYRESSLDNYFYSRFAYIYTTGDLCNAGVDSGAVLSAIAWHKTSFDSLVKGKTGTFTIYVKNTSNGSYNPGSTGISWNTLTSGATKVYTNSSYNLPGDTGYINFSFSKSFTYTGGSLEIYVDWKINNPGTIPYSTGPFNWSCSYNPGLEIGAASGLASNIASLGYLPEYNDYRPDIDITYTGGVALPVAFNSSTASTYSTADVQKNTEYNPIIMVQVAVKNCSGTLSMDSLQFTSTGTTSLSDISNARLFYTTSDSFTTNTQYGTTIASPGSTFTFKNSGINIGSGASFFWLTYDIPATATLADKVHATCNLVGVAGNTFTPTVQDPPGDRKIWYCASFPYDPYGSQDYTDIGQVIMSVGSDTLLNYGVDTPSLNNPNADNLYVDFTDSSSFPIPTITQNDSVVMNIGMLTLSGYASWSGYAAVYIDYNHDGVFDPSSEFVCGGYINSPSLASIPTFTIDTFLVPFSSLTGVTAMRIILTQSYSSTNPLLNACTDSTGNTYPGGETQDLYVNIRPAPPCSGTPTAGSAIANPSHTCGNSGGSVTLSLKGVKGGGNLKYQWQWSLNDTLWSNVTGGFGDTSVSYTSGLLTTSYYFRCIVICQGSGSPDTSKIVLVPYLPNCYCTSGAQYTYGSNIGNVLLTYGSDTLLNNGNPYPAINNTKPFVGYADYTGITPPKLQQGNNYNFAIDQLSTYSYPNTAEIAVYIDLNGDGILDSATELVYYGTTQQLYNDSTPIPSTGVINIPYSATTGYTLMRVIMEDGNTIPSPCGLYYTGETEDYTVDITPAPPCAGKPTAGTASGNPGTLCGAGGGTSMLALTGVAGGGGLTYQWQYSADSITWSNATGNSALATYTTPNLTASAYYRCIVTCPNSLLADTSNKVFLFYLANCYCSPYNSYNEGDGIGNLTITNGNTVVIDNGDDTPALNNINGGAIYINYESTAPNLLIKLYQGVTYNIDVTQINEYSYSNPCYDDAFIDYYQDGSWTDAGDNIFDATSIQPSSSTPVPTAGTFTVPYTADTGITTMRLELIDYNGPGNPPCYSIYNPYTYGQTQDYLVDIMYTPPCSSTPNAGVTVASADTICSNGTISLSLLGSSINQGLGYQWQSSPDNITWSSISGAVNQTFATANILVSTYYRCQVTCTNTSLFANSTPAFVYVDNPGTPTITADSVCGPGNVTFNATGGSGKFYWYSSASDSAPVASGPSFSPYVTSTKTFYASSGSANSGYCNAGYDSLATGYPYYPTYGFSDLAGLEFDALADFNLVGVYIFPQGTGTFQIYLLNASGVGLDTATVNVTTLSYPNAYWVPLNFSVPAGTGYFLAANEAQVNNMADYEYPYPYPYPFQDCNGAVSINYSIEDGYDYNFEYYFFYNWVIQYGCTGTPVPAVAYVKAPPPLSISANPTGSAICYNSGSTVSLSATGSTYTNYSWSPSSGLNTTSGSLVTASPTISTVYTLTATESNCDNILTQPVVVEPPIAIKDSLSPDTNVCPGTPVQIITQTFYKSNLSYCTPSLICSYGDYITGFSFNTLSNSGTVCPFATGGYVYDSTDVTYVQPGNTYSITITPDINYYDGFAAWIDYNQDGVFEPNELVFLVSDQYDTGPFSGTVTIPANASTGLTRLRVMCLDYTPTSSNVCDNDGYDYGDAEDFNVVIGSPSSFSYSWSPAIGLNNAAIDTPLASPNTTTTYILTSTDAVTGCQGFDTIPINVKIGPSVSIGGVKTICSGQSTVLVANATNDNPYTYSWLPTLDTNYFVSVQPATNTTYVVNVTGYNGCATSDTDIVTVNPLPVVAISKSRDTLCLGESDTLKATAGYKSYQWNTGDTTTSIVTFSGGDYVVYVTDASGCVGADTTNIILQVCSGIDQVAAGSRAINVYPNPFSNQFTLELDDLPVGTFDLLITNTLGEQIIKLRDNSVGGVYKKNISFDELASGVYYVAVFSNGESFIKKIVKIE